MTHWRIGEGLTVSASANTAHLRHWKLTILSRLSRVTPVTKKKGPPTPP